MATEALDSMDAMESMDSLEGARLSLAPGSFLRRRSEMLFTDGTLSELDAVIKLCPDFDARKHVNNINQQSTSINNQHQSININQHQSIKRATRNVLRKKKKEAQRNNKAKCIEALLLIS